MKETTEGGRELTTIEKLAILDNARASLEAQRINRQIVERAKAKSKELSITYYHQLAEVLELNPRGLQKVVMAGLDKAVEESNQKVLDAEKTIETYLK